MKNQILIITILALTLTGCAGENADSAGADGTQSPQTPSTDMSGDQPGAAQKRIRGQIQDILGNEVTLALMEEPKRPEGTQKVVKKALTTGGDPMGGPPGGMGQSGTVKLTGETLGLQIPVGVPIVSRGQGGETALQLSDLTSGEIITVQYDTDGVTIIQVDVSSGGTE